MTTSNRYPDDAIRADVAAGLSDTEIAEKHGMTARQIRHRRSVLGVSPLRKNGRPYSDEDLNTIRRMHRNNESIQTIADAVGRTYNGVFDKLAELGLRQRGPGRASGHGIVKKTDAPIGAERNDADIVKAARIACTLHLADLIRGHGGATLGEAKSIYASKNELNILPEPSAQTSFPTREYLSACSSPAAWVV